ncbi:MAG: GTPase [Candidatus Diapherotrites archaeon]
MPINAHPEYIAAEGEYLKARTLEEKIEKLRKMISFAPSHKGGENLRAQLKTRLKKLQEQLIKSKKAGKSPHTGIKKEDMQAVIVGQTNSGKSSLLKTLTNSEPQIAEYKFTTKNPVLGTLYYENANIQLIEIPAIGSEFYAKGIVHTTDTVLVLITSLSEISDIFRELKTEGKKIIVFNKIDLLKDNEKRKIQATLSSKRYNFVLISTKTQEGIEELKNKIFQSFNKIRIYTKEPRKEKSKRPIIMNPNATARDIAEKILKGFSERVKETKIWGPSSKFPGQKVGLQHKLKDLDVVEFKTG